jgi:hypothetical protein
LCGLEQHVREILGLRGHPVVLAAVRHGSRTDNTHTKPSSMPSRAAMLRAAPSLRSLELRDSNGRPCSRAGATAVSLDALGVGQQERLHAGAVDLVRLELLRHRPARHDRQVAAEQHAVEARQHARAVGRTRFRGFGRDAG